MNERASAAAANAASAWTNTATVLDVRDRAGERVPEVRFSDVPCFPLVGIGFTPSSPG
jgi:hypothetical protein